MNTEAILIVDKGNPLNRGVRLIQNHDPSCTDTRMHYQDLVLREKAEKLKEALEAILQEDYPAPHFATDRDISLAKGVCLMNIRKLARRALREVASD